MVLVIAASSRARWSPRARGWTRYAPQRPTVCRSVASQPVPRLSCHCPPFHTANWGDDITVKGVPAKLICRCPIGVCRCALTGWWGTRHWDQGWARSRMPCNAPPPPHIHTHTHTPTHTHTHARAHPPHTHTTAPSPSTPTPPRCACKFAFACLRASGWGCTRVRKRSRGHNEQCPGGRFVLFCSDALLAYPLVYQVHRLGQPRACAPAGELLGSPIAPHHPSPPCEKARKGTLTQMWCILSGDRLTGCAPDYFSSAAAHGPRVCPGTPGQLQRRPGSSRVNCMIT